jgi:trk system potassium uptake protein TrkA
MKVIIMGCGRVGQEVSRLLVEGGNQVTVIDDNPVNLEHLGPNFPGKKVRGVGFDLDVLLLAGIENADAFVATSPSDNINIVAARIARNIFHVPRVVARLYDPRRAEIYRRLGLVTISMTSWGAQRINELLTHTNLEPMFYFGRGEVSLVAIETPSHLVGRTVSQVTVPGEVAVVAITRQGEALMTTLGTELNEGDLLYFTVLASAMERFESLLGL